MGQHEGVPPRQFPAEPDFQSEAERLVFERLVAQLPDSAVLFHGLRLSDRSQDREADLVVAMPGVGIATIEVKGGQVGLDRGRVDAVRRRGGQAHPPGRPGQRPASTCCATT